MTLQDVFNRYKIVPIQSLRKAPWNYKEDDEEQGEKLAENLRRNSQIINMVVREIDEEDYDYEVVDGNHRLDAMIRAGYVEAIVYDLGDVSIEHAQRLAIEINETRFPSDIIRESEIMKALEDRYGIDDLLATIPYDRTHIEDLIKLNDFDWEELDEVTKPKPSDDEPEYRYHYVEVALTDEEYQYYSDQLREALKQGHVPKAQDTRRNGLFLMYLMNYGEHQGTESQDS